MTLGDIILKTRMVDGLPLFVIRRLSVSDKEASGIKGVLDAAYDRMSGGYTQQGVLNNGIGFKDASSMLGNYSGMHKAGLSSYLDRLMEEDKTNRGYGERAYYRG